MTFRKPKDFEATLAAHLAARRTALTGTAPPQSDPPKDGAGEGRRDDNPDDTATGPGNVSGEGGATANKPKSTDGQEEREAENPTHDAPGQSSPPGLRAVPVPDKPRTPRAPDSGDVAERPAPRKAARAPAKPDSVLVKMHLRHPAPGVSAIYDRLAASQGERTAFRLILTAAIDAMFWEVDDPGFRIAPMSYPEGALDIETTRAIPGALYRKARADLDPHGLLSRRQIGTTLGRAALAAYFEAERDG